MAAKHSRRKKATPSKKTGRADTRSTKSVKPSARPVSSKASKQSVSKKRAAEIEAKRLAKARSEAAQRGWETRRKNEAKRKRLAAKEARAFEKPKANAVKPGKLPKVRKTRETNEPLKQGKKSLKQTIVDVATLLTRQHGIDPRIAQKVAESYDDEIVEWKTRGLTSVDIAIAIKQNLDQEGVQFQSTVERAKQKKHLVESQNAKIADKLLELRNTVLRHKVAHGYSPPVNDVWITFSDAGNFVGFHKYVPIGEILTHENINRIVKECVEAARLVYMQHQDPKVRLYSAIELYEFGKDEIGSQKVVYMDGPAGKFQYSYQGHRGVTPEKYEYAIRRKLRSMLNVDNAAAVIESVTVKSFVAAERVPGL